MRHSCGSKGDDHSESEFPPEVLFCFVSSCILNLHLFFFLHLSKTVWKQHPPSIVHTRIGTYHNASTFAVVVEILSVDPIPRCSCPVISFIKIQKIVRPLFRAFPWPAKKKCLHWIRICFFFQLMITSNCAVFAVVHVFKLVKIENICFWSCVRNGWGI